MQSRDIQIFDANSKGSDVVSGDMHGSRRCLFEILKTLTSADRLFLVGDLIDRGEDNLGLLELIWGYKAMGGQVFMVRGNHEEMVLDSLAELEEIIIKMHHEGYDFRVDLDVFLQRAQNNEDVQIHMQACNGGEWLLQLYLKEILLHKINLNKNVVEYAQYSRIKKITTMFKQLPYIIRVTGGRGKPAMNVVHGDMPFDDDELLKRIHDNEGLTAEEKEYAIWAGVGRNIELMDKGRTWVSAITYSGHDIIFRKNIFCVRDSNTINCDFGAYITQIVIIINHTKLAVSCKKLLIERDPFYEKKLAELLAVMTEHFEYLKQQEHYLRVAVQCLTIAELQTRIMNDELNEKEYYEFIYYLLNNDGLAKFNIHTLVDYHQALSLVIELAIKHLNKVEEVEKYLHVMTGSWSEGELAYKTVLSHLVSQSWFKDQFQVPTMDVYLQKISPIYIYVNSLFAPASDPVPTSASPPEELYESAQKHRN